MILSCLGCAIFGITEVPTDGLEFSSAEGFNYSKAEEGNAPAGQTSVPISPVYIPPPPASTPTAASAPITQQQPSTGGHAPVLETSTTNGLDAKPSAPAGELHELD